MPGKFSPPFPGGPASRGGSPKVPLHVTNDELYIVFLKTKDLIRRQGWNQGQSITSDGRLCLTAAMLVAAGARKLVSKPDGHHIQDSGSYQKAAWARYNAALELAQSFLPRTGTVIVWNDTWGRSLGEVNTFLDRILDKLATELVTR